MIILIIHIIVSYDQNISLIFMWKMDPMSGFDIRLVFTLPPRDNALHYKRCVHFWNNFPCITSLVRSIRFSVRVKCSIPFLTYFIDISGWVEINLKISPKVCKLDKNTFHRCTAFQWHTIRKVKIEQKWMI